MAVRKGDGVDVQSSPDEVRGDMSDDFPDHLFRWADAVGRRLNHEMRELAPAHLAAIGGRRSRLLQMIPPGGMRVTDLAHRSAVTKQAVGQLVDTLEALGLVESGPAQGDRRVRWVRRTQTGDRVVEETLALIDAAQQRLRQQVGARRYDVMVDTMRELGRDVTW
jgi:DNA-binding MarR family transcriptional regulator